MDTFQLVSGVVGGILALGAGGGLWTYLIAKRGEPLTKENAYVTNAQSVSNMALQIAQMARDDAKVAREEASAAARIAAESAERTREVELKSAELQMRLVRWTLFGDDLVERWPIHRLRDKAPPLPEPREDIND